MSEWAAATKMMFLFFFASRGCLLPLSLSVAQKSWPQRWGDMRSNESEALREIQPYDVDQPMPWFTFGLDRGTAIVPTHIHGTGILVFFCCCYLFFVWPKPCDSESWLKTTGKPMKIHSTCEIKNT